MKTNRQSRLSASALFYVLLLSTLVAIMLTALISIWVFYRSFQQRDQVLLHLDRSVESGLNFLLSEPFNNSRWSARGHFSTLPAGQLLLQESTGLRLQSSQAINQQQGEWAGYAHPDLSLNSEDWGLLRAISVSTAVSTKGIPEAQKSALVGYRFQPDYSLLLPRNRQPLTLTGKSSIQGDVQVGRVRINTASLDGRPYTGGTPLAGNSLPYSPASETVLPALDLTFKLPLGESLDLGEAIIQRSFSLPALIGPSPKVLSLYNKEISGKVVLRADSLIYVDATTRLEDVILVAPNIQIADDFEGSFQAFATQRILLGDRVSLSYPSYLCLAAPFIGPRGFKAVIESGEQLSLVGGIYLSRPPRGRVIPQLTVGKHSSVQGTIKCQGAIEIQGNMRGNVAAENFIFREGLRERINYLNDFLLEGPHPDSDIPWAVPLTESKDHRIIAKWVE